ncbi:hypothetical protein [Acinetobacter sp. SH20PTE14]|uniref:hypothetical protein n=1 Tax=Acinetobacter sp. SH20PTE14 TaxID=2905879 RepID=UPI001F1BD729|nr:hypothetical protein [Acinetobacter sp. SH20PTE14]UIJ76964.1 hypothetical protein LXF01_06875 [Acinetobacter sp. SH20PTE14]UIJ77027.1 hypothetical protein LXF01_07205 [Acinetobacter sp. SH20PTE14]
MVASTDIKFYVHTNTNAPQLTNNFGCMINVLDACLINGINVGQATSLTATGTAATLLFGTGHNLKQGQVIKIHGADQPEFNGEHRVLTIPNSNTVTFELLSPSSVSIATGTINASLPPLDWEKPFSGTGKAAYRSPNTMLPTRPFLRVVDDMDAAWTSTYAKYAKVGIVEEMTDIDTMFGVQAPFDSASPNKNWVGTGSGSSAHNGWAKWFYALASNEDTSSIKSATPPEGARSWLVVGNSDCFYIFNRFHTDSRYGQRLLPQFFGAIDTDYSKVFGLAAVFDYTSASTSTAPFSATPVSISDIANHLILQRNHNLNAIPVFCNTKSPAGSNVRSGFSNYIAAPSGAVPVFSFKVPVYEGSTPRGVMPLIEWLQQTTPYADLTFFKDSQSYKIAANCMAYGDGQVLFNLGN